MNLIIFIALAAAGGLGVGYVARQAVAKQSEKREAAKRKELLLKAKDEALKIKEQAKKEEDDKRRYLQEIEKNLRSRENNLDRRYDVLEKEKAELNHQQREIISLRQRLQEARKQQEAVLEKAAKLKKEDARDQLFKLIEKEYRDDVIAKIKAEREEAREAAQVEARKILSLVIERLASEHSADNTSAAITLPSEDMKGRIIGKEGRNIQIFEKMTGVDILIDDTPDTVTVSCFEPVRRFTAKLAMEKLLADGRINPSRIEETVKKAEEEINKEVRKAGEQAAYETSVAGLHPDLLKILGRLKFRTSYGQNVLQHSIESTYIASMLASELGADVNLSKKAALLHDIGKAVDQDVAGAHHHISAQIAEKYGLSKNIIHAIEAHHDDVEAKTVEAIIVRVADAISGARPGARRDTVDAYLKRLEELENLTNSFEGVEKSYAIQAGREVRIIVRPTEVDDLGALKLSKDIARKIEQELKYPGTIKVNVIRETRAVEFAK